MSFFSIVPVAKIAHHSKKQKLYNPTKTPQIWSLEFIFLIWRNLQSGDRPWNIPTAPLEYPNRKNPTTCFKMSFVAKPL